MCIFSNSTIHKAARLPATSRNAPQRPLRDFFFCCTRIIPGKAMNSSANGSVNHAVYVQLCQFNSTQIFSQN